MDGRPGRTGTILQHPLFDEIRKRRGRLPPEFVEPDYRVPGEILSASTGELYYDPLAKHTLGSPYKGRWIAAAANVAAPLGVTSDGKQPADTGLVAGLAERARRTLEPLPRLVETRLLASHFRQRHLARRAGAAIVKRLREPERLRFHLLRAAPIADDLQHAAKL